MTITNNAAWEQPGFQIGEFESNVDYSAESPGGSPTYQFLGMVLVAASGSGVVGPFALQVAGSAGVPIVGVLQNNPIVAEAADLVSFGVSKVQVGSAGCTAGDILAVDSTGKFVTASSTNYGVAMALQTGTSGQIISAYIDNYGKQ